MTECRTERIPLPDGSAVRLTAVEPESVVRGGIVVFHGSGGVTDAVRKLAEGLAREGWLTVVPHLYHSEVVPGEVVPGEVAPGEVVHGEVAPGELAHGEGLSVQSVLTDADGAFGWLAEREVAADRMGVVGVGLGGTVALLIATRRDLGAAVTVDGIGVVRPACPALPALVEAAPKLRCPWLGVYSESGAAAEDELHKLQDAVCAAQVATDLVFFTDTQRFGTVHSADVEAWIRTLNWFDSHLR